STSQFFRAYLRPPTSAPWTQIDPLSLHDALPISAERHTLGDTQLTVSESPLTSSSDPSSSVTEVPRHSLCGMQAPCGHPLADSDHPIVWMRPGSGTLRTPWGVDRHDERRCRQ